MVLGQPGPMLSQRGMRQAAVLGRPIAHSRSPVLHRAAYAALGLDWRYRAIEVDEAGLEAFLDGLDDSWAGLSLTMPLKVAVLGLLDESDDLVQATGAANTVVLDNGRRIGFNTDVAGMASALEEAGLRPAHAQRAGIVGAGATARSAAAALARLGIPEVDVSARRPEAAAAAAQCARDLGLQARVVDWAEVGQLLRLPVVISTLPGDAAAFLADQLAPGITPGYLLDVTYHPWPTHLARAWASAGGVVIGGLAMLLWQAAEQVRLMTGDPAPVEQMRAALAGAEGGRVG